MFQKSQLTVNITSLDSHLKKLHTSTVFVLVTDKGNTLAKQCTSFPYTFTVWQHDTLLEPEVSNKVGEAVLYRE